MRALRFFAEVTIGSLLAFAFLVALLTDGSPCTSEEQIQRLVETARILLG